MDTSKLKQKIEAEIPGALLEVRPFGRSLVLSVWVETQSILPLAALLRNDSFFRFDWLENFSVMDIDQALVLTYFLRSTTSNATLVIRGSVVPSGPEVPVEIDSVCSIWPMAALFEQEIQELFGLKFKGKYSERKILPENWSGFPLRKAYVFPSEFMDVLHMRPPGQTPKDDQGGLNE